MIIDFEQIEETVIPHFKGGEKETASRIADDGLNKIMRGCLIPGATIGYHQHDTSSEVIFIIKGNGHVLFDGERLAVCAGQCHYCPRGHSHSLINDSDSDLEYYAVVPQQAL